MTAMCVNRSLECRKLILFLYLQLEETNNTLTKDVQTLTKENADLIEKVKALEEGRYKGSK